MMKNKMWLLLTAAFISMMTATAQEMTRSGLNPKLFQDTIDGKPTALYTLTNENGAEACITNYGARLVSLMMPNWNGRMEDVVLGYDNVRDYHTKGQNFGATVGRYVGRIGGPSFTLDGQRYDLQENGKGVISHGGNPGFQNRVWDVLQVSANRVIMQYISPDGENGFPGELKVKLTYTLGANNALDIAFEATTNKPTVLNLTNHSFFNISGDLSRSIEPQHLWLDSKEFAEYDANKNVTGRLRQVYQTPMDFRKPHQIGSRINKDYDQLKVTGGYDHCYKLKHGGDIRHPAAIVYDTQSGRTLTVYTTEPAIQIYTGNGLKGNQKGKDGIFYPRRSAICLETMHFPNSPNLPQFPSTVLMPGETYHSKTIFRFSTDPPQMFKEEAGDAKLKNNK